MKKAYKKVMLVAMLTITLSTLFLSCNKYPEGPAVSLMTRKARLAGNWQVENYKINSNDFTSLISNYTETFSKDGNYAYSWGILGGTGTWMFQNSDKEVKLTGGDNQTSRTLYIIKLESKSLWYYYMQGDDKHELHLIPQ